MRVAISVREGQVSSTLLLRRLRSGSKRNAHYTAFREVGRVIRTVQLLRYLLRLDQRTHRYVARRTTEGLSRREIIRCLQRYVARELYQAMVSLPPSSSSWPPQGLQRAGQP
jgi:TnpA family transposase